MEKEFTCKVLKAIYKDEKVFFSGPHKVSFIIARNVQIKISIEQCGIRNILIEADKDIRQNELYAILTRIERLLMLFDGYFLPLSTLYFSDSDSFNEEKLNKCVEHIFNNRLSCFTSADFCKYDLNRLMEYDSALTADLYTRWEQLLDELDVVHQMYLYSLCDRGVTVDIKCAFLIELAEPLIEMIKMHKNYFSSLSPGERGTTLKNCLDALITKYGVEIFNAELNENYDKLLSIMVYSRVRIMHIKRGRNLSKYFDGNESVLYANKMSLLYRHIIFELLDIDEETYHVKLHNCISGWNKWNDVLERLQHKLSKR